MKPIRVQTGFALALLAGLLPASTGAAPRVPQDAAQVLEILPARIAAAQSRSTDSAEQAAHDALALLRLAQREGDPRYLGRAEARLEPWLESAEAPPRVRLLRARVLQARHRFDEAARELDTVLAREPRNSEALLLQASIHLVRGQYRQARITCQRARTPASLPLALACEAMVDGLNGHAQRAYAALARLASVADTLSEDQQAWLLLGLGDLADRIGLATEAGAAYQRAANYSPDALAAWCDWLLEQGRASEVVVLLQDKRNHDGLLLRLAGAEALLDAESANEDRRELAARFAAAAERGERTHLREEALYALYLEGDPARALELARANWAQQREPADARIWLEAARASGASEDIAAIEAWRNANGLEDRRLVPDAAVVVARGDVP